MDYAVPIQMMLETAETNNIIHSRSLCANSQWFYLISKRWLPNYNPSHTPIGVCVLKVRFKSAEKTFGLHKLKQQT